MAKNVEIGQRLKEERKRLKLTQQTAAELCSTRRETWVRYESGAMSPGAEVLAALAASGADVLYILTGQCNQPLSNEERMLLESWRNADFMAKHEALRRLTGDAQ